MSHILTVFGATGQQGSSVINHVLKDTHLSSNYHIRAISRNASSPQAKSLAAQVEVVCADTEDRESLKKAMQGTHTVFAMTNPSFAPSDRNLEFESAQRIADAAVEAGAQYIIFSTTPSIDKISSGKYTKVQHFEAKYSGEQYIRSLPIKSAFIAPGWFMENFGNPRISPLVLDKREHGWSLKGLGSPQSTWPLIAARDDIGKFVGAILADPGRYEGQILYAACRGYSMIETASVLAAATGQQVEYTQLTDDQFKDSLLSWPEAFYQVFASLAEFGYYGVDTARLVEESARDARGMLLSLEEYLQKYPLELK